MQWVPLCHHCVCPETRRSEKGGQGLGGVGVHSSFGDVGYRAPLPSPCPPGPSLQRLLVAELQPGPVPGRSFLG